MKVINVIHDCDPGQDDTVCMLTALAFPEKVTYKAITTVAGNVSVNQTAENALKICELAGKTEIKVYKGMNKPLVDRGLEGTIAHGDDGLQGVEFPKPQNNVQDQHAVDFLIETLMAQDQDITLFITGPMTNIACALQKEPALAKRIKKAIIMGGSPHEGNITRAAEYNVHYDPHAAEVVFNSGIEIALFGLNVTNKVIADADFLQRLRDLGHDVGLKTAELLQGAQGFYREHYEIEGTVIHDACVAVYALRPDLFKMQHVSIDVETADCLSHGRTNISPWKAHRTNQNILCAVDVDKEGVLEFIYESLKRYG